MRNVCIIGAGELGSRHLQGVLKYPEQLSIFVLDTSQSSLDLSQKRASEIAHNHKIVYSVTWNELPFDLEIAIIATSANVREGIVSKLLTHYNVRFLILEKVLFQSLDSYSKIGHLITSKKIKAWVNHPRRMYAHYKTLKSELTLDSTNKLYTAAGGNWGLGCNALHFIDLFSFLDNSKVNTIEINWVDNTVFESRRKGFVEFTGTILGELENGSKFVISSLEGTSSPVTLLIASSINRWLIQEGGTSYLQHASLTNGFKSSTINVSQFFQSDLTKLLIHDLLNSGDCELPTYEEAQQSHLHFINALLKKYNEVTGEKSLICPIT